MTLNEFYQTNHNLTYTYPELTNINPFGWITGAGRIPYLPLQITGPWKEILEEAQALDDLFVSHRDDGSHQGWASLCLHGLGAYHTDAASIYPEFKGIDDDKLPYKWTEIAERCPVATEYFKTQFPYQSYMRLRFMRLAPGGYIAPHNDSQTFRLGAVNISLNNPVGCEMVLEGVGVVPYQDSGSVMALNTSYNHIVWNQSDETRYHMIVHGMWNYKWNNIVVNSYKTVLQTQQDTVSL